MVSVPADLLERTRELDLLGACLDQVRRTSRGLIVLVEGEAGVGNRPWCAASAMRTMRRQRSFQATVTRSSHPDR